MKSLQPLKEEDSYINIEVFFFIILTCFVLLVVLLAIAMNQQSVYSALGGI